MATTKIWPVRDSLKRVIDYASNPEKTSEADLASVIRYAMNGDKTAADNAGETEKACYVTGVNCSADTAHDELINTQKLFGKTGGNVAYHCYQSFKPGEVTPEHAGCGETDTRCWSLPIWIVITCTTTWYVVLFHSSTERNSMTIRLPIAGSVDYLMRYAVRKAFLL